jgi:phosphohistidine phosphatase
MPSINYYDIIIYFSRETMKTLLILRHAKSSWDDPSQDDRDRPLNPRGFKTAPLMGEFIQNKKLIPDAIFSSPAARAIHTAKLVAQRAGCPDKIQTITQFYPGDPNDYIETLSSEQTESQIVMVIGHNPGLELLLEHLTDTKEHLPTGALAQIQLPIEHWSQLTLKTKGLLIDVFRPKEIFKELLE